MILELEQLYKIIDNAFEEDIQTGDHSSLSCVPRDAIGSAVLLVKDRGVIAGVELAKLIFERYDPLLKLDVFINDGTEVKEGDVVLKVNGSSRSILATERLVLNFMQRMSGIATKTRAIVNLIEGTNTKILDTRKTTPGIRLMEKMAVKIGGAENHRFGLYDMIMLKDNHIDYAGGVSQAITKANAYVKEKKIDIKIEIEVRDFDELNEVLEVGGVNRIMLDNFLPSDIIDALKLIPDEYEVEASGGINETNVLDYAKTGVDYISIGSLTHNVRSLDLSLKAKFD